MGVIRAVCISDKKGEQKHAVRSAELRRDHGIVGDAHAGSRHRQVSLLAAESIERMREVIPDLADGAFAENLVTAGLNLTDVGIGDRFRAGGGVILEVTQIGKECHDACAIGQTTGECIMPREGIFCRVLAGGSLRPGDSIWRELRRA